MTPTTFRLFYYSTYAPVASIGLFLYDYLLTLHDEARFVWFEPWSVGKALFLLTRYVAFPALFLGVFRNLGHSITPTTCSNAYAVSGWLTVSGMVIAEVIIGVRAWALWDRSKRVALFIAVVFISCTVAGAFAFFKYTQRAEFFNPNDFRPPVSGCVPITLAGDLIIGYISLMCFEGAMMALTIIKAISTCRGGLTSFMYAFYQEGIIYYVVLTTISVLNVVELEVGPPELANVIVLPQHAFHSILSARMLLRLRRDANRRSSGLPSSVLLISNQAIEGSTWFGDARSRCH